jgi:hypothetical protein
MIGEDWEKAEGCEKEAGCGTYNAALFRATLPNRSRHPSISFSRCFNESIFLALHHDWCMFLSRTPVEIESPASFCTMCKSTTVCHCFAEAVRGMIGWPGTTCAKQWHAVVRSAG